MHWAHQAPSIIFADEGSGGEGVAAPKTPTRSTPKAKNMIRESEGKRESIVSPS